LCESSDQEEKYATCFASNLLMPDETVRPVINKHRDENKIISFERLDAIARQFDVSLQALIWRIHFLYDMDEQKTLSAIERAEIFILGRERESGEQPPIYPERYRSLAIRALQQGEISLGRFAQFMNISRRKAQDYVVEGEVDDAQISVTIA